MLAASLDHHWNLRRIPIMLVVLGELEIPVYGAGVGVQRQQGIAVEVVACPPRAAIRRRRISRRPENLIRSRIIGSRVPGRGPPRFPGIALPTFMPGLAWPRNRIEAPFAFARRRVIRINKPAYSILPAGNTDHHQTLHRERRHREAIPSAV